MLFEIKTIFFLLFPFLIICQNQWIFLHYHKTGAVLSEEIARAISNNRFIFQEDPAKRRNFKPHQTSEILISHAGNLLFNWTHSFNSVSNSYQYRIVHFVRDPYDMILSGLLYHAQNPPPEHWLVSDSLHPCMIDENQIIQFISIISTYHSSISKTKLLQSIEKIVHLCNDIYGYYAIHYGLPNYHRTLSKLLNDQLSYKALQLEACRSIISKFLGAGGDILRMAANSVREGQAMYESPNLSKRIFLSEFSPGNKTQLLNTLTQLFQFLLTPSSSGNDFWKDKITLQEAINIGFTASYIDTIIHSETILSTQNLKRIKKSKRLLSSSFSQNIIPQPTFSQLNWMHSCNLNSNHVNDNLSQNRILSLLQKEEKSTAQLSKTKKYQLHDARNIPTIKTSKQMPQRQSIHRNNHITQGIWSRNRRKDILCLLANDPILSPILNLVHIILQNPLSFNSTSSSITTLISEFSE